MAGLFGTTKARAKALPKSVQPDVRSSYDAHKDRVGKRQAAQSKSGRNIGDMPAVVDPKRKVSCRLDFGRFCTTYSPDTFYLPWSEDHLKVIARIETVVLRGGLYALAMPRGSGKTSLVEQAATWAMLYGHHRFIALIGATEPAACEMLTSIRMTLETEDLFLDDFPEVVFPIRALEGITNRCGGQLFHGKQTRMKWKEDEIIFPSIEGSQASAAIIRVAGITGRVRGMKSKTPDGRSIRPTLVLPDDPQTDDSAKSLAQNQSRAAILAGAILGLAGPGKKVSGVMPCTVIRPGDMVDTILDRAKHPAWNGERTKMVYSFPTNLALWEQYGEIWGDSFREHGDIRDATEFYRANRAAMDEGAVVAWEENHDPDELSGLQSAMNLKLRDEPAFWAEYQNSPLPDDNDQEEQITVDQITQKLNGHSRGSVPVGCDALSMFIDVQGKLLYWMICAWETDFTGYIIAYGAYPDQKRRDYTLKNARVTLAHKAPGAGLEGSIYAGLVAVCGKHLGSEWRRGDGAIMHIDQCIIDANWGTSTDTVYQFCRQSEYAAILLPSHGMYVGASSRPFDTFKKQRGDKVGLNWRVPNTRGKRAVRHALIDTNFWKSFVSARLAVPMGDKGCLSLYGRKPVVHQLLAGQLVAEYCVRTEGRGRTVDEWKTRPGNPDNHWFDCLVGCAVGASMRGASLPSNQAGPGKTRRARVKLSDIQKEKRQA